MNRPYRYRYQRTEALEHFRSVYPFLQELPDPVYFSLDPSDWYEPQGIIERLSMELAAKLNAHILIAHRFADHIPWHRQLETNVATATLPEPQRALLAEYNDSFADLGIHFVAYTKPLKLRKKPLEHPMVHCEPPEGY